MTFATASAGAHPIADLVRILLILLPGAGIAAIAGLVWVRYLRIYRTMIAVEGGWLGLLPRHVLLISTSYLTLIGYGVVDTARRFHHPLTPRPFVFGAAFLIGMWAMWDLLDYERHRKHRM